MLGQERADSWVRRACHSDGPRGCDRVKCDQQPRQRHTMAGSVCRITSWERCSLLQKEESLEASSLARPPALVGLHFYSRVIF